MKFLDDYEINLVFDIGANIGQSGLSLRNIGYQGRIVSFDPLASAFAELQERTKQDRRWTCEHLGLSDHEGKTMINISSNSQSSSILEMLPLHSQSSHGSSYVGKEEINLSTVDLMMKKYCQKGDRVFLKIDSQGCEKNILEGTKDSFAVIYGIELEMSFLPLYMNAILFSEMHTYMIDKGYSLVSLEPIFFNPKSGQLLQVNGLYFRMS